MRIKTTGYKALRIEIVLVLALVLGTITSCSPKFDYLKVSQLSTPPTPANVMSDYLSLTAGSGVMIKLSPVSSNSIEYDDTNYIEMGSSNNQILRVIPGRSYNEFAVVGISQGETTVRVTIDGKKQAELNAVVE